MSQHHVSSQGLEQLKKELLERKSVIRKQIITQIELAKELGDLSENFEYHDAKEQQGYNETRIMQLEEMIQNAVVVSQPTDISVISIGSKFVAESDGKEKSFEIVGSQEANPLEGKLSSESPLGSLFIGKAIGDKVELALPQKKVVYTIKKIS